jgi:hypothetical protein
MGPEGGSMIIPREPLRVPKDIAVCNDGKGAWMLGYAGPGTVQGQTGLIEVEAFGEVTFTTKTGTGGWIWNITAHHYDSNKMYTTPQTIQEAVDWLVKVNHFWMKKVNAEGELDGL